MKTYYVFLYFFRLAQSRNLGKKKDGIRLDAKHSAIVLKSQLCAGPNLHVDHYTNKDIGHCRTYIQWLWRSKQKAGQSFDTFVTTLSFSPALTLFSRYSAPLDTMGWNHFWISSEGCGTQLQIFLPQIIKPNGNY